MVRISHGCRNCVKRRVKCDETSPSCQNCRRLEIECGGPKKLILYLYKNTYPAKKTTKRCSNNKKPNDNVVEPARKHYLKQHPGRNIFDRKQENVRLCFLEHNYESHPLLTIGRPGRVNWITICMNTFHQLPVAGPAIRCLSTLWYERYHRDTSLVVESLQLYSKALHKLHVALQNSCCNDTFDILAATSALHRYENLMFTSHQGWIAHAGGIGNLIQMSGPDCFQRYPNKAILDANWYPILFEAHLSHKGSFLDQPSWHLVQEPKDSKERVFQELRVLYARLTTLVNAAQTLLNHSEPASNSTLHCQREFESLLEDLRSWLLRWQAEIGHPPYETIPSNALNKFYSDAEGVLFLTMLHHVDEDAAIGFNLCHALQISALGWYQKLRAFHLNNHFLSSLCINGFNNKASSNAESIRMAVEICRSIHYHFDLKHGGISRVFFLLLCCGIAYHAFVPESREQKWLSSVLDEVADRHGVAVARQLKYTVALT